MKLKTRIKITFMGMLAIVLALNTAIILFYVSDSLKKSAKEAMQSVNKQRMITMDHLFDTFVTLTQKPLIDDTILEILRKDYSEYPEKNRKYYQYKDQDVMSERLYTEMFYKNEYIYAVTILVDNGKRIYSKQRSGKGVLDISFTDTEWYQELYTTTGTEAILFPYMKEDLYRGEEPVIALGRLLKDPMTNQPMGIIRVDIAVKDLKDVWEDSEEQQKEKILFCDQDGNLLYTSFNVENWESEYQQALKTDIAVTYNSDRYEVSVTSLLPGKELYRNMYDTILIILCIAVGCMAVAFTLTELTIKGSLRPIGELNELMKKVRCGDLSVRARVQSTGEFEEVCESFNLMVENTEHLIEKIRQEEEEKREAEYKALQAQISPHFIMNTINTIKWMAVIQGNRSIEKALDSFAHLLSFVVKQKDEKITIGTELEQMGYYIDILALRYYNKFQIDIQADKNVKNCYTIKFLLQTLVENSVFHGFDEMEETGKIQISIKRTGDKIVYEVKDNGKGISEERIKEILEHGQVEKKGMVKIGLYNINRRIKLIFGEDYGIYIKSEPGIYTQVLVTIPIQEADTDENCNCG